jgi:membrane-associated phospholipid phosphatase
MVVVVLAHLADPFAWRAWRLPSVYDKDWGRLLRSLGYLPTWGAIALAYWLQQRDRPKGPRIAAFLLLAPALGGALAELLKLLFRRLRPNEQLFSYAFRPFSDAPWSTGGLGLPSSHTLVAFSGGAALARVFPRAAWLFYLLAAVTRVMANAHYLSDAALAACLGWAVGAWLGPRFGVEPEISPAAPLDS